MLALAQLILAQGDSEGSVSMFFWGAVLLVAVVVGMIAVKVVRSRMSPNEDFHGDGFSLADLRQLHKSGKLSDEEYQMTKAKLVETLQAAQSKREAAKIEAAKHPQKMI